MANSFSKEERVAFESVIEGFNDAEVMSKNVTKFNADSVSMERSSDTIWRPQPYIACSYSGTDMTSNFTDYTQLSVPATIGFEKGTPLKFTPKELRDAVQEQRLGVAARQKLASDINIAVLGVACDQGTVVVKRTSAATGLDDVGQIEAAFNEQGVNEGNRVLALNTRDYLGMAKDLGNRQTLAGKTLTAYEKSYIGQICSFDTFKLDYSSRLTAAAGVTVTINGANQYYVPKATSTAGTGETSNVDNRTQNITIGVVSGTVKAGDCFTIAGVNSVHHITKVSTGQLKTFRIRAIVSGGGGAGVVTISPPIISNGGATTAEAQYQNVDATPANGAAITFLNTASTMVNPFWVKDAIELLPGRKQFDPNAGAAIMKASTDSGIEVVMQKQYDIDTQLYKVRFDIFFGVVNLQPEMTGIMLFNQT